MLTSRGPRIVESHNRVGGDRINELAEIAYGVDMERYALTAGLGVLEPLTASPEPRGGAAIRFLTPDRRPGRRDHRPGRRPRRPGVRRRPPGRGPRRRGAPAGLERGQGGLRHRPGRHRRRGHRQRQKAGRDGPRPHRAGGRLMSDFEGLAAIVTGGASGIGLATARLLHSRGAVGGRARPQARRPARRRPGRRGRRDRRRAGQDPAVDAVAERFGRLDVVVNNAGISAIGDVAGNSDDEWLHVLDVNVVGMVRVARHALPHLRRSPPPRSSTRARSSPGRGCSSGSSIRPARARSTR